MPKELEAILNIFLWADTKEKRRYHLVRWDDVKKLIRRGGSGLRSITTINKALHAKWIWHYLVEINSFWKKNINIKWMRRDKLDNFCVANRPQGLSLWKAIMNMFKTVYDCSHWQIGRGDQIKFRHDLWIGDTKLKDKFPMIYAIDQNSDLYVRGFWQ